MNILVISSNLIGDNILSTGILRYFLEKHPNSKFTIVLGPSAAPLYKNFPNLEKITSCSYCKLVNNFDSCSS